MPGQELASRDSVLIHYVRVALVGIGDAAVSALIGALSSPNDQVRWEAAKILSQIKDPTAAPALVNSLEDSNAGVRWLAAETLISLKREGIESLLHGLINHKYSEWLRQGAHHVIRDLTERKEFEQVAAQVLAATEAFEPAEGVPRAALAAIDTLRKTP